jgi:uncharacterized alkaline shock family protein YloU
MEAVLKETEQGYAIGGITVAPGVIETIISLAAAEVPGVAGVGTAGAISTIMSAFNAGKAIPTGGVQISIEEDERVAVSITVQAFYGYRLIEIAEGVRNAVTEALAAQIGVEVTAVDVHVDALSFEE